MVKHEIFERKNVKTLRDKLGLTQREFANILEVTIFAVSSWENIYFYDSGMRLANSRKLWKLANKNRIRF